MVSDNTGSGRHAARYNTARALLARGDRQRHDGIVAQLRASGAGGVPLLRSVVKERVDLAVYPRLRQDVDVVHRLPDLAEDTHERRAAP